MSKISECRECGAAITETKGSGCCPRCLIGLALNSSPDSHLSSESFLLWLTSCSENRSTYTSFNNYEILSEIAQGGMGIVFKALQKDLKRIVAIKMLPHLYASDPERVRRFRLEAEAAARLHHPNIVTIHEVGEVDGHPFFSMEYVEGFDLAHIVSVEPLSPANAAETTVQIAEAIGYAHQRGVLHRDLKPANVLMRHNKIPVVTDFGLAKLIDDVRSVTLAGKVMGTPGFLAPEQAETSRGEVTVATDVYGVGAILYFLLTHRAPFQKRGLEETLLAVLGEEPLAPRSLRAEIPRDLETICLKCLSKEPTRRYASTSALADDLRRWQRLEPIIARPSSVRQRIALWTRRNPIPAVLVATLAIVLTAASIAQFTALRAARQARADAESLVEFLNEDLTAKLRPLGRLDLMQGVSEKISTYFNRQPMESAEPELLGKLGRFYQNAATTERELGKLQKAEASVSNAVAIFAQLQLRQTGELRWASGLSDAYRTQAKIWQDQNHADAACQASSKALRESEWVVERQPNQLPAFLQLMDSKLELVSTLERFGFPEKAGTLVEMAAKELEELKRRDPDSETLNALLATARYYQGLIHLDEGQPERALSRFREYLAGIEESLGHQPGNFEWQKQLMIAYGRVGQTLSTLGRCADALSEYKIYLRQAEMLTSRDPSNFRWQRELGNSLELVGDTLGICNPRSENASNYFARAKAVYQTLHDREPTSDEWNDSLARYEITLATYHQRIGDWTTADQILESAISNQRVQMLSHPDAPLTAHQRLARLVEAKGDSYYRRKLKSEEAQYYRDQISTMLAEAPGSRTRGFWRWTSYNLEARLARALRELDLFGEALGHYETALRASKALWRENPEDAYLVERLAENYFLVAYIALRVKEEEKALEVAQEGVAWISQIKTLDTIPRRVRRHITNLTREVGDVMCNRDIAMLERTRDLVSRCRALWVPPLNTAAEAERRAFQQLEALMSKVDEKLLASRQASK